MGTATYSLVSLANAYYRVHGYLGSFVCCVVIASNAVTAVVLTRPHLRSNINTLLCGIAVLNCMTSGLCLVFLLHYRVQQYNCPADRDSAAWAMFELAYANLPQLTNASAITLTACMAAWRYAVLSKPVGRRRLVHWNPDILRRVFFGTFLLNILLLLPNYLTYSIKSYPGDSGNPARVHNTSVGVTELLNTNLTCDATSYFVTFSDLAEEYGALISLSFGIHGIVLKIIPCTMIGTFSILMALKVSTHERIIQRRSLSQQRVAGSTTAPRLRGRPRNAGPATHLLLIVFACTIIGYFPNGVLCCLVMVDWSRFQNVYFSLGDLLEQLTLIQMITTFALYCSTSSQFRRELTRVMRFAAPSTASYVVPDETTYASIALQRNTTVAGGLYHQQLPLGGDSGTSSISAQNTSADRSALPSRNNRAAKQQQIESTLMSILSRTSAGAPKENYATKSSMEHRISGAVGNSQDSSRNSTPKVSFSDYSSPTDSQKCNSIAPRQQLQTKQPNNSAKIFRQNTAETCRSVGCSKTASNRRDPKPIRSPGHDGNPQFLSQPSSLLPSPKSSVITVVDNKTGAILSRIVTATALPKNSTTSSDQYIDKRIADDEDSNRRAHRKTAKSHHRLGKTLSDTASTGIKHEVTFGETVFL